MAEARWPSSDDILATDPTAQRCSLCWHLFLPANMREVNVDNPNEWRDVCVECYETVNNR